VYNYDDVYHKANETLSELQTEAEKKKKAGNRAVQKGGNK
jgi:hypothetical protein